MNNKEIARLIGEPQKNIVLNNSDNKEDVVLICLIEDMEIKLIRNGEETVIIFKNLRFKIDTDDVTETIKVLPIFFHDFKENHYNFVFICTSCKSKVTIEDINIDAENSGFGDFKFLENNKNAYCVECFENKLEWEGEVLEYIY